MILNAYFDGQWHNAEIAEETSSLITELIATLAPSRNATLCFAGERFVHKLSDTKGANGCLQVAVNKETGYGALLWYWGGNDPVWVSDNPEPPDFNPRVVADPGGTYFHEASSTLPLRKFREVLEEFCYSGTGERPARVRWVRSDMCGRRLDGGYYDRVEVISDRFEDSGFPRGMIGYVIGPWSNGELRVEFVNPDGFTGKRLIMETRDLRLLTRGSAGFWPFLMLSNYPEPWVGSCCREEKGCQLEARPLLTIWEHLAAGQRD